VAGRKIAAVAMTEAGAGSDLAGMRTTARLEGGQWVLDGGKLFIANGVQATSSSSPPGPVPPAATATSRCSSSRRARRDCASRGR
jgi:alkylation response protein AidB-like acyl-CoA dehydrogenase